MDKIKKYEELLERAQNLLSVATDGFPMNGDIAIATDMLCDEISKALREPVDDGWISVEDELPPVECDVLVAVDGCIGGGYIIAMGFYEDGKRYADDSGYNWDSDYIDMEYDDDADDWIVPQGWYESVSFNEEFAEITDKVVYWRYLPEPPKGE